MAVPVETSAGSFRAGTAEPLFEVGEGVDFQDRLPRYQPAADGRRFLVSIPAEGSTGVQPLDIILNWPSTLRQTGGR